MGRVFEVSSCKKKFGGAASDAWSVESSSEEKEEGTGGGEMWEGGGGGRRKRIALWKRDFDRAKEAACRQACSRILPSCRNLRGRKKTRDARQRVKRGKKGLYVQLRRGLLTGVAASGG